MTQELLDQFMTDMNKINAEINKVKSPILQAIMWLKSFEELLKPVWQNGFDKGYKEGLKKGKEEVRIIKSN